jgi:glycosyltransferase involved in cell wall biosynthesis
MADAMARRTPVIATAYSGNLDFMTPETAELIPYELVEVGPGAFPYAPDATWADPDLGAASAAMRRIFENADHARDLAGRAFDDTTTRFSAEATAGIVRDLLMAPYREDHE